MSLQEFMDLHKLCPMCKSVLITKYSYRKQKSKIENDKFISIFTLKGMRSGEPSYEIGYSFEMKNSFFGIEFYDGNIASDRVSLYMCDLFKKFHANMGSAHRFIKACILCTRYEVISKPIYLDLKNKKYDKIEKDDEFFVWSEETENGFRLILLNNYLESSPRSKIYTWYDKNDYRIGDTLPIDVKSEDLGQIPFSSKEETGERIKKLLLFS